MSGPKCDEYILLDGGVAEQQNIYARNRQEAKKRRAQERRRQEELRRQEQKRREEERRRLEEQQRQEEERRIAAENRRIDEFNAQVDDVRKRLEELKAQREAVNLDSIEIDNTDSHAQVVDLDEETDWDEYEKVRDEFQEAFYDYQDAAELAGEASNDYSFDIKTAAEVIAYLKKETDRLAQKQIDKMCQKQVNKIFKEIIEDMGYEVMADHEVNDLSEAVLLRFDENTAINVMNNGNQFVMEVVATDRVNRPATEKEASALEEKMAGFCQDYQKILDRIETDGRLGRKPVYHMQPDKRYARIVNLNEYTDRSKAEQEGGNMEHYNRARYETDEVCKTSGEKRINKAK